MPHITNGGTTMQEIPIPLPTKGPNRTKTNIAHYVMGWASSTMHFSENPR
jgi:hypothetical protein